MFFTVAARTMSLWSGVATALTVIGAFAAVHHRLAVPESLPFAPDPATQLLARGC